MDLGIKGKQALVIGGTSGIGLGIATALAEEGAQVTIASRNETHIETTIEQLRKSDLRVEGTVLDMLSEESLRSGIGAYLSRHNADILVNNAGGPPAGNTVNLSLEDWDKGYQLLLRSVLLTTGLILPKMREQGWGRILTITSTAARELIPKLPVSSTFRAGLRAWVKNLSKEIGRDGVLINNLEPGPINTDRLTELKTKSPAFFESMESETAVGRIGETSEVGKAAAFLCSQANGFITGSSVIVDGGYTRGF